jgi:hypothetical protein
MKKFFTTCFLSLLAFASFGQRSLPVSLSFFDNQTQLLTAVFGGRFHPGLSIGTYHLYRQKPHHEWFQTLKLGYFYHQFSEQAVQLYTEAGYRYLHKSGTYAEALAGVGYLHAFPDVQQFDFENGRYVQKKNFGRPQFMATAALLLGYDFDKKGKWPLRLFLEYQFWLQMPFVNKYVPVLPNTAIHLGVVYQLPLKKK